MSKKLGELDWSEDLTKSEKEYKHIPTALWAADQYGGGKEGVDPLDKSEKRIKEGEVPYRPTDKEISDAVMHNAQRQPTDEEMFGKFVVTEEMAKAAQEEWEGRLTKSLTHPKIGDDTAAEWTGREPLTKGMTEEELAKWRMHTD